MALPSVEREGFEMRALRLLLVGMVVGLLVTLGLGMTGAPSFGAKPPDPDAVHSVAAPVQVVRLARTTPTVHCAVGVFVPFNDLSGWVPDTVTYDKTVAGHTSTVEETIGDPPYDDAATQDGLVFTPTGAAHQTQLGDFSYSSGGDCVTVEANVNAAYPETATVSYVRSDACQKAIKKLLKAGDKLKRAKKALADATTPQGKAVAQRKVEAATKKQKKAQKKYKKVCG